MSLTCHHLLITRLVAILGQNRDRRLMMLGDDDANQCTAPKWCLPQHPWSRCNLTASMLVTKHYTLQGMKTCLPHVDAVEAEDCVCCLNRMSLYRRQRGAAHDGDAAGVGDAQHAAQVRQRIGVGRRLLSGCLLHLPICFCTPR
jgi:hypothetical protein